MVWRTLKPFQSLITGIYIRSDETKGMAYVKARSAGVREHVEDVAFGPGEVVQYTLV